MPLNIASSNQTRDPTMDTPANDAPMQQIQSTTDSPSPSGPSQAQATASIALNGQTVAPLSEANLQAHLTASTSASVGIDDAQYVAQH
ncbi:hypothetical protein LTR10_001946 [Elasticomyces elasticus]|nr:hypothetical protein LTR10_001946 [Elasticomyces elasticus]KAK4969160.1 hypothetical protein LTR42_009439 [Elasticomyces elasticus]